MKEFRIWVKEKWTDSTFKEINFLKFDSVRSEEKGLGAASARILLTNYSPFVSENWDNGNFSQKRDLTNWWVFVEAVDLISRNKNGNSSNYQPPSNSSPSFIWWGYCGEYTREIQRYSKDSRGSMNLYEIGHWFAKQKINYEEPNANGFNPIFDSSKGTPVGNKDVGKPYAAYQTFGFEKNGRTASIDPEKTDNFFTCKEAINHIVMRSIDLTQSQFKVKADWSLVNTSSDGENSWLNESESIDSFEGKSLTEALENILDTFTWTYEVDSETNDILVRFKDRYLVGTKENPLATVYLDMSNESFYITSEQQVYDHIQLVGDRILFYNSLTTYTPMTENKSIGVFPKWTDSDLNKFLLPMSSNLNYNKLIEEIKNKDPLEGPLSDAGIALTDSEERDLERALSDYKALRQKYSKNVYQDFTFGYCYPENPILGGECLATWVHCGDWNYPENSTKGADLAIACYPKVTLQKPLTEASNEENILQKKPKDLILENAVIESELLNSNGLDTHQTPACTEMKYEEVSLQPDSSNESFLRNLKLTPTFYYRTYGKSKDYNGNIYPIPVWLDGTQGGSGLMSSKMSLDWDGVTLESDEPEMFACYYDWIYQTAKPGDVYEPTVKDFGVKRNEWKNDNVGASKFDYYHRGDPAVDPALPDWGTVAHWGRMVFSFGSYSRQRLVLDYGKKAYTKTLTINDEGYKMAIARRGFVSGIVEKTEDDLTTDTEIGTTLNYNRYDRVIVNDMPTMAARMTQLWNYWSRPKSAAKIVNAMFSSSGTLNRPLTKANLSECIGTYIGTIKNVDGVSHEINSYVSSVEYDFSADQPRIIIQTEYPDSPKSTREKTVKGVWKKRKNDWNRENL